jgi:hypothetical protein
VPQGVADQWQAASDVDDERAEGDPRHGIMRRRERESPRIGLCDVQHAGDQLEEGRGEQDKDRHPFRGVAQQRTGPAQLGRAGEQPRVDAPHLRQQ